MRNRIHSTLAIAVIVIAGFPLAGCGTGSLWPFKSSQSAEPNRVPAGATEYTCAAGTRLLVRYTPDGKSAWIIFPDREFRLDRAGTSDRYTNGVSTLTGSGDEVVLDSEGARLFAECKRKQGA